MIFLFYFINTDLKSEPITNDCTTDKNTEFNISGYKIIMTNNVSLTPRNALIGGWALQANRTAWILLHENMSRTPERIYKVCIHELCHIDYSFINGTEEETFCQIIENTTTRNECNILMQELTATGVC